MTKEQIIQKLKWVQLPLAERCEMLQNPYRGLYTIYKFFAHDELVPELGYTIEESVLRPKQSLCLIEINLVHYNESPLSEEALDHVRRIFSFFSGNQREMIVRFVYDWDGKGFQHEPREIGVILEHMQQLSPLLKQFMNSIYILQGLFIGSWGEMHNSRYMSERNIMKLAHQLYKCSGERTYIAVRCPSFWRTIFKTYNPLSEAQSFSESMPARFSLFNDGILASDTDFGTYGILTKRESTSYSDKLTREEELDFQDKLCRYVPNGGETVYAPEGNNFNLVCQTFKRMHVSYLNADYDRAVLMKWQESKTCIQDVAWKDKSVYDYIVAHLGYRFSVEAVKVSLIKGRQNRLCVSVKLKNTGFSCSYRRFNVSLVVQTATISSMYCYPVETDTRRWRPDVSVLLESELNCSQWDQQLYILGLSITDPESGKHIQLANSFSCFDYNGLHSLGYMHINYR